MSRRTLIAGNWKMHKTLAEARELVASVRAWVDARREALGAIDVVIFPPAPLLFPMAKAIAGSPIRMGAQNAHFEVQGAFTGEISPRMVKETGCAYLLVGHSERRHLFGERGEMLGKKVRTGLAEGLHVIYCVGETLAERQADRTQDIVTRHLEEAVSKDLDFSRVTLAYEPVWAIGTGQTATPQQAQDVHRFIRGRLAASLSPAIAESTRILYGGSVKPDNAAALLAQPDIDGLLVGGACLAADSFSAIIAAALNGP